MDFKNDSYLKIAEQLTIESSSKKSDAKIRTVVNRSYYHAFLQCRDYKNVATTWKSHEAVRRAFLENGCQIERDIGKLLEDFQKKRRLADYNNNHKFTMKDAMDAIIASRDISELLQQLKQKHKNSP